MISMYAEYSGRTLYVCLSTDNNADDFKGAKNGDTMYHMDTGKRYVYNEVDKAFHELPEEGGGGGLPRSNYHVLLKNGKKDNINQIQVAQYNANIDGIVGYPTSRNAGAESYVYIINDNGHISIRSNVRIYGATYNDQTLTLNHYFASAYHYANIEMPANYDETIPIIIT